MQVAGEAADGFEAVQKARELKPNVILLDLMMPRMDGIEAIPEILRVLPDAKILVLTSYSDDEKIVTAIKAGALGYILKDSSPQELLRAIHAVHRGEAPLPPSIARKLIGGFIQPQPTQIAGEEVLSRREVEVLRLIARGFSNREIARTLVVSERTVHSHVSHILLKLRLPSRTQAALYALRAGLADLHCA